jgi:hypothetical protein
MGFTKKALNDIPLNLNESCPKLGAIDSRKKDLLNEQVFRIFISNFMRATFS